MSSSYISFVHTPGDPGHGGVVQDQVPKICDYLNNNIDGHTFNDWDWGECDTKTDEYGGGEEKQYIKDVIAEYVNGPEAVSPHETFVIAHDRGFSKWGYGASTNKKIDGDIYHGCTVNANLHAVTSWEAKIFTWHEVAHNLTDGIGEAGEHGLAEYDVDSQNYMENITPLAASYLLDSDYIPDTRFSGTADPPDSFCYGEGNQVWTNHQSNRDQWHDWRFSSCTLDSIQQHVDDKFA